MEAQRMAYLQYSIREPLTVSRLFALSGFETSNWLSWLEAYIM
jgi:hypothetical protein